MRACIIACVRCVTLQRSRTWYQALRICCLKDVRRASSARAARARAGAARTHSGTYAVHITVDSQLTLAHCPDNLNYPTQKGLINIRDWIIPYIQKKGEIGIRNVKAYKIRNHKVVIFSFIFNFKIIV